MTCIADTFKEIDLDNIINESGLDGIRIAEWLKQHLIFGTPSLLSQCGGSARLLLSVPERSEAHLIEDCLRKQFDEMPTVIPSSNGSVSLCYEAEGIPLRNVLLRLMRERPSAPRLRASVTLAD